MSNLEEKVVLILVGLVGSGKSAFASSLERHFPGEWRRCNQDELGNRSRVEDLARASLHQGLSVCIDRTNFNESQRASWINIAHEYPGTVIWVIVFDTPYEVCASRLQHRTSHPTIHSPAQGLGILSRFAADYRPPRQSEGFNRMMSLKPEEHTTPDYTSSEISTILQRVRDSPAISMPVRTSWADRRRATRPYRRPPYSGPGRASHRTPSSATDPVDNTEERPGFFSRVWEQGSKAIFQSRQGGSASTNGALGSPDPERETIGEVEDSDEQKATPSEDSRDLLDPLGVD